MGYLTVHELEWAIAELYFKANPQAKKLRRKDVDAWQKFSYQLFDAIVLKKDEIDESRHQTFIQGLSIPLLENINKELATKYESWFPGELRVHSFEKSKVNGRATILATAVHATLGKGGEAKVKVVESKEGHVFAKRVTEKRSYLTTRLLSDAAKSLAKAIGQEYEVYISSGINPTHALSRDIWTTGRNYKSRAIITLYDACLFDLLMLKSNRLCKEKMIQIAKLILSEAQTLEREGFIHRDIKTENIMINTPDGKPTLNNIALWEMSFIDLGYSLKFKERQTHIQAEQCGTPGFIPPEFKRSNSSYFSLGGTYAHRHSDRYSLGVTLHWILMDADLSLAEQIKNKLCVFDPRRRASPADIITILDRKEEYHFFNIMRRS